jgi:hypothetical protein
MSFLIYFLAVTGASSSFSQQVRGGNALYLRIGIRMRLHDLKVKATPKKLSGMSISGFPYATFLGVNRLLKFKHPTS